MAFEHLLLLYLLSTFSNSLYHGPNCIQKRARFHAIVIYCISFHQFVIDLSHGVTFISLYLLQIQWYVMRLEIVEMGKISICQAYDCIVKTSLFYCINCHKTNIFLNPIALFPNCLLKQLPVSLSSGTVHWILLHY